MRSSSDAGQLRLPLASGRDADPRETIMITTSTRLRLARLIRVPFLGLVVLLLLSGFLAFCIHMQQA